MKTLSQIGAVVSFACFFIAGSWILLLVASTARDEGPIPACIGLCLVGTAFYLGPKLWLAAEAKAPVAERAAGNPKGLRFVAIGFAVLVVLFLGLAVLRSKAVLSQREAQPAQIR
jgi:hypothetical protein